MVVLFSFREYVEMYRTAVRILKLVEYIGYNVFKNKILNVIFIRIYDQLKT